MEYAHVNLMETMIRFFYNRDGNILDVGCGKGASTKFLTKYFDPAKITGINIMKQQLDVGRVIAPECNFQLMDATQLSFKNASHDNILCIEAAFHFSPRQKFFEEAARVLKPSGRMVMLDALCDHELMRQGELGKETESLFPKENDLPNLEGYRESLLKVGFSYLRIEDCTNLTANPALHYVTRMAEKEFGRKRNPQILEDTRKLALLYKACSPWCMMYAIR
jgi:MPBQ/MSBQ methyltransferase